MYVNIYVYAYTYIPACMYEYIYIHICMHIYFNSFVHIVFLLIFFIFIALGRCDMNRQ